MTDLMDELKDGFYPIQTSLWLKEDNVETVVGLYRLQLSTKPLLNHSKSMKEFN